VHVLRTTARIRDLPSAPQQADRVRTMILDPYSVSPYEAIVVRARLISEKK
jgi:hypothetical protein